MSTIVVILARRGSKGVPGKNMALVGGRPCLAWTIDDALASSADRVVVSTDWPDAGALARRMGCETVDRPPELAGDTATVDDAVRHALRNTAEPDAVVILYANVPVRPAGLVDLALAELRRADADAVQSFAPVGKHHPWWMARVDPQTGRVSPWEGDRLFHGVCRRQDLPHAYVPDGGVLVATPDALWRRIPGVPGGPHAFLGREDRRAGVITAEGDVVDIDSPIDLVVADAVLRGRAAPLANQAERAPACTGGIA